MPRPASAPRANPRCAWASDGIEAEVTPHFKSGFCAWLRLALNGTVTKRRLKGYISCGQARVFALLVAVRYCIDQIWARLRARTPKSEGGTDGRSEFRQVPWHHRRAAWRRRREGHGGSVLPRRPAGRLPGPGRADHGLRGGVRDGDLR